MSRNTSGTYTLPAGNPVVSGTTIASTWANNTMSDFATEMTDSLSRSGKGAMLAAFEAFDGTVSVPGIGFGADPDNWAYRSAANTWHLVVAGAKVLDLTAAQLRASVNGTVSVPIYSFANDTDTGIYLAAAGDVRVAVGGADVLEIGAGLAHLKGTTATLRTEDTNHTADAQIFEFLNSGGVFALRSLQDNESTVVATPISVTHAGVITLGTATTISGAITANGTLTANAAVTLNSDVVLTGNVSITDHTDASSSNSVTFDFDEGNILECALTENITSITLSNLNANGVYEIWITQHASSGPFTVSGWSGVTWVGGSAPTMNTTASALTAIQLRKNGAIILGTALNAG